MKKFKLFLSIFVFSLAYSSSVVAESYCHNIENLGARALDIPQDSLLMLQMSKGKVPSEMEKNPQLAYDVIQGIFKTKFSQKEDAEGHKQNTQLLIGKMVTNLECDSIDSLRSEFKNGVYKNIKLYTDESVVAPGEKATQNYEEINHFLRERASFQRAESETSEVARMIESIDQSLSILPSVRGVVYRGTSLMSDQIKEIIQTGLFRDTAYLSSSVDVVDAYQFLMRKRNTDLSKKVIMVMYSKTGKFIPFGEFSREEEVLFKRGTTFELKHHFEHKDEEDPNSNAVYLFLEEK